MFSVSALYKSLYIQCSVQITIDFTVLQHFEQNAAKRGRWRRHWYFRVFVRRYLIMELLSSWICTLHWPLYLSTQTLPTDCETCGDWSCYEMLWEFFRWLGKFNCKINVVICNMPYVHTLNKIINATLLFKPPFFMSWIQRSKTFSMYKNIYFSQILFTNLSKSVLVSTSPLPR